MFTCALLQLTLDYLQHMLSIVVSTCHTADIDDQFDYAWDKYKNETDFLVHVTNVIKSELVEAAVHLEPVITL